MFPQTIRFAPSISLRQPRDSLLESFLIRPLELQYGKAQVTIPPRLYRAKLRIPLCMKRALKWFCDHDQQILFLADALACDEIAFHYDSEAVSDIPHNPVDSAEMVCDFMQADGVPLWLRQITQPSVLKMFQARMPEDGFPKS